MAAKAKKPPVKKVKVAKPIPPMHINHQAWDKPAVMAIVCEKIASSTKSIVTILAEGYEGNPLPTYTAIKEWLSGSEDLAAQYARAKEDQADFMAEEMAELHNKAWVPVLVDGLPLMVEGKPLMTVDKASAAAVRLEADNKKWLMGKLRPKKYGDRMQNEHSGPDGGDIPVSLEVSFVQSGKNQK